MVFSKLNLARVIEFILMLSLLALFFVILLHSGIVSISTFVIGVIAFLLLGHKLVKANH